MKIFWAVCCAVFAAAAYGQETYPSKTVRLIAAAAPGGNPDVLARMLAAKLADAFGRPFVWSRPSRWRARRPTATR
jgi:tripartite-type tricarboxylate transporter receptor subunit TctC